MSVMIVATLASSRLASTSGSLDFRKYFAGAWDTTWQMHSQRSGAINRRDRTAFEQTGLLELRANESTPHDGALLGRTTDMVVADGTPSPSPASDSSRGAFGAAGAGGADGLHERKLRVDCDVGGHCVSGTFRFEAAADSQDEWVDFFRFDFAEMGTRSVWSSHAEWWGGSRAVAPPLLAWSGAEETLDAAAAATSGGAAARRSWGACQVLIVSADHYVATFYSDTALSPTERKITVLSARRRPTGEWSWWSKALILFLAVSLPAVVGIQKVRQNAKDMRNFQVFAEAHASKSGAGAGGSGGGGEGVGKKKRGKKSGGRRQR